MASGGLAPVYAVALSLEPEGPATLRVPPRNLDEGNKVVAQAPTVDCLFSWRRQYLTGQVEWAVMSCLRSA